MDLDTFFVSCERLIDSSLIGRPILVGGTGNRGVVSAASYEARKYGASSGMSMKLARMRCPEATVIRGNSGTYTTYSKMVTEIIKENVPVLEKSSIDEFYADLSGMDKFFGSYKFASELRQTITKETGLPISFGLSINKTVSKVATNEAKPNNQLKIDHGFEKKFLAPLSVRKIPMVGEKTYYRLRNLGIKRVETLQNMPIEAVERIFGKNGRVMWKRANGIDKSPIIEYQERKSISSERTFDKDTINMDKLKSILIGMTEQLAFQLRNEQKICSVITLKIRYSDFNTYTKQIKIPYTAADHMLIPVVLDLFKKLYGKRLLIRLIGVRLGGLTGGNIQFSLFDDVHKTIDLYHAMDHIRNRFGHKSIVRASALFKDI